MNFFQPLRALQNPNLGLGGVRGPDPVRPEQIAPPVLPPGFEGIGPPQLTPPQLQRPQAQLPPIERPSLVAEQGDPGWFEQARAFAQQNPDVVQELMGGGQQSLPQLLPLEVKQFTPPQPSFTPPEVVLPNLIFGR